MGFAASSFHGQERSGRNVGRAAAFGSRVVIIDEPTAALGVRQSRRVLELILDVKKRGLPIVLISRNMPHVLEVADRIHIPGAATAGSKPRAHRRRGRLLLRVAGIQAALCT